MSASALRAVRELRGDGESSGRPFTPRTDRPGTATSRSSNSAAAVTVLQEEIAMMQKSFTQKLQKAQDELQRTTLEYNKQIRSLKEELEEEKKKNAQLMDRITRLTESTNGSTTSQ